MYYNQAILNDLNKKNEVQCFNIQHYNEATGQACCCSLWRSNKFAYGYILFVLVALSIASGSLGVCSRPGMIALQIISILIIWVAGGCLYLESRFILAPMAAGVGPVRELTHEGSTISPTAYGLKQKHKITESFVGFDPYRDAKRAVVFCVIYTIGVIIAITNISPSDFAHCAKNP